MPIHFKHSKVLRFKSFFNIVFKYFINFTFKAINPTAIATIFITSIWPIISNTVLGVQSVNKDYINVARVLKFSPIEMVYKIMLPVSVPYIFTGMRLSLGIAWIVIVAAEMLTGGTGIGFWIWDEYNNRK
jgi:nitrate/nitrite transport system permease protein